MFLYEDLELKLIKCGNRRQLVGSAKNEKCEQLLAAGVQHFSKRN